MIDPSNTQPPVAAFTAPAVNAKVTELTAVTGTISDNGPLARWKLEYRPADGSASWTVLKEVTSGLGSSVNVSESFDPTLLANGAEPGHEGAEAACVEAEYQPKVIATYRRIGSLRHAADRLSSLGADALARAAQGPVFLIAPRPFDATDALQHCTVNALQPR